MYKKAYINVFKEAEYDKYLSNRLLLEQLKNSYLDKYTDKSDAYQLAFKESLDHYVTKQCLENKDFINSTQFSNYCEYLGKIIRRASVKYKNVVYFPEITNNVFLSDPNLCKIFANKTGARFEALANNRKYNNNELQRIYTAMKQHQPLSQEEIRFISDYIYSSRDSQENLINTYLRYMFNDLNKNIVSEPAITGALLTCCSFIYKNDKKVNKESRFYVTEKDMNKKCNIAFSKPRFRYCVFQKSYLDKLDLHGMGGLNISRSIKNVDLYWLMFVAFHELTHQHQDNEVARNSYSSSALSRSICNILCQYMPKKYEKGCEANDYNQNHDADEIEMEADEEGWKQLSSFIRGYLTKNNKYCIDENGNMKSKWSMAKNNVRAVQKRRTFSMKQNNNSSKMYYAAYDMQNLISIVKNNPEALNGAPNLKKFFAADGRFSPIGVLTSNLLKPNDGTTHHQNNSGYELCVEALKHSSEIYKAIESRGITESEAIRLIESLQYIYYGGKHKFEDFRSITNNNVYLSTDIKQYNETKTKFDFDNTKEIEGGFLYHYSTTVYAIIAHRKLSELIKSKYPRYKIPQDDVSWYRDYLLSPINTLILDAEQNEPISINLLENPRLQALINKAKILNIKELNKSIDYYIMAINQFNEKKMDPKQSGRSR